MRRASTIGSSPSGEPFGKPSPYCGQRGAQGHRRTSPIPCGGASAIRIAILAASGRQSRSVAALSAAVTASGPSPPPAAKSELRFSFMWLMSVVNPTAGQQSSAGGSRTVSHNVDVVLRRVVPVGDEPDPERPWLGQELGAHNLGGVSMPHASGTRTSSLIISMFFVADCACQCAVDFRPLRTAMLPWSASPQRVACTRTRSPSSLLRP